MFCQKKKIKIEKSFVRSHSIFIAFSIRVYIQCTAALSCLSQEKFVDPVRPPFSDGVDQYAFSQVLVVNRGKSIFSRQTVNRKLSRRILVVACVGNVVAFVFMCQLSEWINVKCYVMQSVTSFCYRVESFSDM